MALEQPLGLTLKLRRNPEQVGLQTGRSGRSQEGFSKNPAMRFLNRDAIFRRLLAKALNHWVFKLPDD